MNIKQALDTAVSYENRVRDVYRAALAQANEPDVKKLLHGLAKEEHEHLRYLHDSIKLWTSTGQLMLEVLHAQVDEAEIRESVAKLRQLLLTEGRRQTLLEILQTVLAMERETSGFYERVSRELSPPDAKFFARFVEAEYRHLSAVQRAVEALAGVTG